MARNKVQFQKGLSERRFRELYGTEAQCRAVAFGWRWPNGFVCPRCGGGRYSEIKGRRLYQCRRCRHHVSLTAGTIFHSTHLPLSLWFQAIYLITQSKKGISSLELARRLGVTQTTAWKVQAPDPNRPGPENHVREPKEMPKIRFFNSQAFDPKSPEPCKFDYCKNR